MSPIIGRKVLALDFVDGKFRCELDWLGIKVADTCANKAIKPGIEPSGRSSTAIRPDSRATVSLYYRQYLGM